MAPGGGTASSSCSASRLDARRRPRATACHERSGGACAGGRGATKVPRPGRGSSTPSAASAAIARCTVTGEARWRAISSRTEGRRSPGERAARSRAQVLDDARLCVIVEHEQYG